ncbi:hypothetical protein J6590_041006 [Homalodisca vitripennis]|nr:hypothetical protein J6590_041006 [Homalodisca vitripennis]
MCAYFQELTYEIAIYWQEAQLPKLIKILLDIISSNDSELIPVALGVLVNLCHKNKPAVYTLMSCVDIKVFLRKVLNLQREHVETSVQVCKLVMILDNLSGNIPDAQILSFVQVSFLRIQKVFKCGNVCLMRHIVSFFRHAKGSEHGRKILLTYPTISTHTNTWSTHCVLGESGAIPYSEAKPYTQILRLHFKIEVSDSHKTKALFADGSKISKDNPKSQMDGGSNEGSY